ncbi:MAG TPA: spermidine/putrescine ABC transporter substrate-binding protein [Candidatus Marinimicrobia bacterium]|nr:spermidine/putrescine ABC transporter substrate-binding protein [Candidatus Neomarinimicrobiota bacterium]
MKKWMLLLPIVMVLSSCGSKLPELHIYNWDDYIEKSILKEFEKEYNCRIIYDTFASNEDLLAKFQAGAKGYDVIFPSDYMVNTLASQDMLYPIQHDKIPNLKYLDEQFSNPPYDPGLMYSIPYTYGFSGIGYDTDAFDNELNSWKIFWDAAYNDRMILLDDMREVFGIAFKILGYSINDTDPKHLAEAAELLKEQKKYLRKYDSAMSKNLLLSGEVALIHHWSGDVYQLIEEDGRIAFSIPEEGSVLFTDCMAIPKTAQNLELAEKFIDFILRPEISARIINTIWYPMPNTKALELIDPEIRSDENIFPPAEVIKRSEFLQDLGEYTSVMEKVWTELKIN